MKKISLFILFFIYLITSGHAQEYPHFTVEQYDFANYYYPKGEIFRKDTLYYFPIFFQDFNFVRPLKQMLQELLEKEIYNKNEIKDNPILGRINFLYSEEGQALRIIIRIYKDYLQLFPDKLLWKINRKINRMKLKLSPIEGGIIKRPRQGDTQWVKDKNGNSVIASFGEKVEHFEFFPLNCCLNREVHFGVEERFTDQEK